MGEWVCVCVGGGDPGGGGVAVPRAGGGEVFVGNGRFAPHMGVGKAMASITSGK